MRRRGLYPQEKSSLQLQARGRSHGHRPVLRLVGPLPLPISSRPLPTPRALQKNPPLSHPEGPPGLLINGPFAPGTSTHTTAT